MLLSIYFAIFLFLLPEDSFILVLSKEDCLVFFMCTTHYLVFFMCTTHSLVFLICMTLLFLCNKDAFAASSVARPFFVVSLYLSEAHGHVSISNPFMLPKHLEG